MPRKSSGNPSGVRLHNISVHESEFLAEIFCREGF
jgi:hypothetical protein